MEVQKQKLVPLLVQQEPKAIRDFLVLQDVTVIRVSPDKLVFKVKKASMANKAQ